MMKGERVISIGSGCPQMWQRLQENHVTCVLDVRQAPGSMARHAKAAGMRHVHFPWLSSRYLGRTRSEYERAKAAFEEHLLDPRVQDSLQKFNVIARGQLCAMVGTQRSHHRCHRSIIGDALNLSLITIGEIVTPPGRKPKKKLQHDLFSQ